MAEELQIGSEKIKTVSKTVLSEETLRKLMQEPVYTPSLPPNGLNRKQKRSTLKRMKKEEAEFRERHRRRSKDEEVRTD